MAVKNTNVCGMGNAIVDIPLQVERSLLAELNFTPGSARLVSAEEQAHLLKRISAIESKCSAGGSVANSIVTVAELDGSSAFSGRLADDPHGLFYKGEFDRLRVKFGNPLIVGGTTGTSVVLITPDGERTMRAALGVSHDFSPADLDRDAVKASTWLFVEGYLFANGEKAQEAIFKGIDLAKRGEVDSRYEAKVALTLSDTFVVNGYRDLILTALNDTDLVFANSSEAKALTGAATAEDAFQKMKLLVPNVVVTAGANGAYVLYDGVEALVPTRKCTPLDTTGAGDAFAGGFLYGVTNGHSPIIAARGANYLASKVIQHRGARLAEGVREAWGEGIANPNP